MSPQTIRKIVIPAAGLGTRFLPATKVVPKELMPIAGRPLIQYAVEEAAASGIDTVILVVTHGKRLLAEYFHRNLRLESTLLQRGKYDDVELIRRLSRLAEVRTVWQEAPLGLADAIRGAHPLVGDEPFAVILPDALIDSHVPCTRQLMTCYENHPGCVLATQTVAPLEVDRFGILDVMQMCDCSCRGRTLRVSSFVERPKPGSVASRYGIFGRYVLDPEIFRAIEHTRPGFNGELQLTDALRLCAPEVPIYAYCFEGTHYDAGSKFGFLQATLAYALKDPDVARRLHEQFSAMESTPAVSAN